MLSHCLFSLFQNSYAGNFCTGLKPTTLLKLQVEEVEVRRALKRKFQEDIAQKKKEFDATLIEIENLRKEKLQGDQRKNNDMAKLKMKEK